MAAAKHNKTFLEDQHLKGATLQSLIPDCYIEIRSHQLLEPIKIGCDYSSDMPFKWEGLFCHSIHNQKRSFILMKKLRATIAEHNPYMVKMRIISPFRSLGLKPVKWLDLLVYIHPNNAFFSQEDQNQFQAKLRWDRSFYSVGAFDFTTIKRLKAPHKTDCIDYGKMTDGLFTSRRDCLGFCIPTLFYERYQSFKCHITNSTDIVTKRDCYDNKDTKLIPEALKHSLADECHHRCLEQECLETHLKFKEVEGGKLSPKQYPNLDVDVIEIDLLAEHDWSIRA